jgi:hypothetical protein
MKKFRIQITWISKEGLKKTIVLRKKFNRLSDGVSYFKKIVPASEKIIRANFLA